MSDHTPLKRCNKCKREKPRDQFSKAKKSPDGLFYSCKACNALYRAAHREEIRKRKAEYYAAHREELKPYFANYRLMHRESIKKYHAVHHITYRAKNSEQQKKRDAAYRTAHPDKSRASTQRYHARKRGLPHVFSDKDFNRALEYFHGACAYCGNPPSFLDANPILHADHYIPLSDTEHCPGTVSANILPACQDCNLKKSNKSPHDWLVFRFGKREAAKIEANIVQYFESLRIDEI